MTGLVIVGAGGFGLEVAAYAEDSARAGLSPYVPAGFLDDTKPVGTMHAGLPVLGGTDSEPAPDTLYVLAVGNPMGRADLAAKLDAKGVRWARIVHPSAYVAAPTRLSDGVVIAPFAFVAPVATLRPHAVLNVHSSVGHEAYLGAYSVLSPYAGLMGRAIVEDKVLLGAHATVMAGVTVREGATLAAGAIAYNEIPAGVTAMGNPAKWREG